MPDKTDNLQQQQQQQQQQHCYYARTAAAVHLIIITCNVEQDFINLAIISQMFGEDVEEALDVERRPTDDENNNHRRCLKEEHEKGLIVSFYRGDLICAIDVS